MKLNIAFALFVSTMTIDSKFDVVASLASVLDEVDPPQTRKTKAKNGKKDGSTSSGVSTVFLPTVFLSTTSTRREFKCRAPARGDDVDKSRFPTVPYPNDPACEENYCKNTLKGIFTQIDAIIYPNDYDGISTRGVEITCTIPCPGPGFVPSDSDKIRYDVACCGDYTDSNGNDVYLPEIISKGAKEWYHPRGALCCYNMQGGGRGNGRLVHDDFLWGGSCGGLCQVGGSSAHSRCTFAGAFFGPGS